MPYAEQLHDNFKYRSESEAGFVYEKEKMS
jgi:hypothetical protein